MRLSRILSLILLCAAARLGAQPVSEADLEKARDLLRATPTDSPSPPKAEAKPAPTPPPPIVTNAPAPAVSGPAPAAPASVSDTQAQALKSLTERYLRGEITPTAYHRMRSEIIGVQAPTQRVRPAPRESPPLIPLPAASGIADADGVPDAAQGRESGGAGVRAALVPGADLVARVDFAGLRQAPIYPLLNRLTSQSAEANPAANLTQLGRRMEEALGIKEEDVAQILVSLDLDGMDFGGADTAADAVKNLKASVGIGLSKDVTLERIKQAVGVLAQSDQADAVVTVVEESLGGQPALAILSSGGEESPVHVSVVEGKTVLMGFSRESLSAALSRASKEPSAMAGAMAAVFKAMPATSQIQVGFVMPASLKGMISAMSAPPEGGAGGPESMNPMGPMLAGLGDLRTIALGVELSEALSLNLSGDLGKPDAAAGLAMMLELFKGQLQSGLAESMGKTPQEVPSDILKVSVKGNVLSVGVTLNRAMLESLAGEPGNP